MLRVREHLHYDFRVYIWFLLGTVYIYIYICITYYSLNDVFHSYQCHQLVQDFFRPLCYVPQSPICMCSLIPLGCHKWKPTIVSIFWCTSRVTIYIYMCIYICIYIYIEVNININNHDNPLVTDLFASLIPRLITYSTLTME